MDDEFGRLSRTRLPSGVQLFRTYNDRQQLTHLISSDSTVHYEYSYDLNGNLLSAIDHINGVNSAFTYDANGRQNSESTVVDGYTIPVQYAFDRAGRLTRTLLPGSNAVDCTYTAAGLYEVKRMQGVTALSSAGTESYKHTYASRDLSGRLLSANMDIPTFDLQTFDYTYDSMGRLSTVTAPGWTNTVAASGGYDAVGNLLKHTVTDPVGILSYTNGYSALYQLTNHQSAIANQQFSYDSIGNRLTGPSAFNLSSMDYTYDALNELTAAKKTGNITNGTVSVPVGGIVQPNPNTAAAIVSVTVKLDNGTPTNAVRTNEEWNVIGGIAVPANGSNHTLVVTATDATGKINAQTNTVSIDSASSKAYIYDLNGNLLQQTIYLASGAVETTSYKYDALERLTSVETRSAIGNQKSEMLYDALHRRVSQEVYTWNSSQSLWSKASSLYFLWTGQSEIGAFDSAHALTQLRILGEGMGNEIGAAVAVELGTNRYISVHDERGSVAVLLNPAGTVAESYRYDAYGNVKIYDSTQSEIGNHQSAIGNPWMFSSKRTDHEVGLVCFGRRFYDPTLGRFVTADPSGFADGPNLYAYCGGDPVNLIDPDGQISKSYSSGSSFASSPGWLSSTQNDLHNQQTYGYSFEDSLRGTMAPGIAAISSLGSINSLQHGLDIAGMAHPAFDVLNAGISWARGDNVGAAASLLATATIVPSAALKGSVHVADTMSSVVNSGRRTISSGLSASSTIENSVIRTGGGLSSVGASRNISRQVQALSEANITDNGITVLGRFNVPPGQMNYIQKATTGKYKGSSYFDLGAAWTPVEGSLANQHFLDIVGGRGDKIIFSTRKNKIPTGTSLDREVQYLQDNFNYKWVNQWSMQRK